MPEEPEPEGAGLPSRRRQRRRWSTEEKIAIVRESFVPGVSASGVARYHGIAPNQLFTWRRHYAAAARQKAREDDVPVPGSRYRALQRRVQELEWLLGKKTLENEMLRRALNLAETTLQGRDPVLPNNDEPYA